MVERKLTDNCTLCGEPYTKNDKGQRVIFPYPPKHYLCFPCFTKSLDEAIERLNKTLSTGNIDLSVEEISDIIKPDTHKIDKTDDLKRCRETDIRE